MPFPLDLFLVCFAALFVAGLTLFSGFGLGTLLLPVFAVFFPIQTAIAATAIVHLANNIFKLFLVGRYARWDVVLFFGLPAVAAACGGALLLGYLSVLQPAATYHLGARECTVTWTGVVIGSLIALFSLVEFLPFFDRLAFGRRYLPLGGALSGFFGGLSGHQGALRAAFLVKCGLTKETFVGTAVICSAAVDVTRLFVYWTKTFHGNLQSLTEGRSGGLLAAAILSAFLGSFIGARLLKKVTMKGIQRLVGILLLFLAAAIASGVV